MVLLFLFVDHFRGLNQLQMKRTILLMIAFITLTVAQAQISKGSTFLGGSINFSNSNRNNTGTAGTLSSINIAPAIGKAINTNLIAGIKLNYSHSKAKDYDGYAPFSSDSYGGGFFIRKYIPIINRVYLFGDASINGYSFKSNGDVQSPYPYESKGWSVNLTLEPGISLAVTKSFYIDLSINNLVFVGYQHVEEKNYTYANSDRKTNSFSFTTNLESNSPFTFGFRFILPKK